MRIIRTAQEMQNASLRLRQAGRSIGLVPTMGYLHAGHLSLAQAARAENDIVIMSNFVNPIQFGPQEDLASYPRDFGRDSALAESVGVDYIFAPAVDEMYPQGFSTHVEVSGPVTEKMCGHFRPGHFRGVTTVVMKLFQIAQPTRAYFGQKDAQQAIVIRKMVRDLNLPLDVVTCPIVREPDGLAMSSRNTYLSLEEHREALVLSPSLQAGKTLIESGEKRCAVVRERIFEVLNQSPLARIDYVEVCNGKTLEDLEVLKGPVLLACAVYIGKTRLIDNIYLEV
jgi:pantoate--beta-alanine ligase